MEARVDTTEQAVVSRGVLAEWRAAGGICALFASWLQARIMTDQFQRSEMTAELSAKDFISSPMS